MIQDMSILSFAGARCAQVIEDKPILSAAENSTGSVKKLRSTYSA